jgi:hypothetical protein
MKVKTDHLCLTCKLASWKRTESHKLHPDGSGRCKWVMPVIKLPGSFSWPGFGAGQQLNPIGGWIDRQAQGRDKIVECAHYDDETEAFRIIGKDAQ